MRISMYSFFLLWLVASCSKDNSATDSNKQPEPMTGCAEIPAWPDSSETTVVGDGTAASCTEDALRQAISKGGSIRFHCGEAPVTITIQREIQAGPRTILDGDSQSITLDGGGSSRILVAPNNGTLSVRNLRFIRGATHGDEADGIGGAVAGLWRSAVEVRNCVFEDNSAERGGGAVSVWTGSSLVIVNSQFLNNRSYYGGAIYSLLSSLQISNSEFTDNETLEEGYGDGGAIGTDGASEDPDDDIGGRIEICGTIIQGSKGHGSGGGAYLWVYPPDEVLIEQTTVKDNTIGGGLGGGMRISNGSIEIRSSRFLSNTSDNHGGALYLDCAPSCNIVNTTFAWNNAKMYGGAISGVKSTFFNNVTFAYNTAGGHGGALFGDGFTVHNSLFVDNSAGNPWNQANNCGAKGKGDHNIQWHSESQDGGGDSCVAEFLVADPLLGDSLMLSPNSPAHEAGNNCEATDQRGQKRNPNACDLGSMEIE